MTKTVIITGASSGVGRSLVTLLKDEFTVVAAARRVEKMNDAFGDDPKVDIHQVDLASPTERQAFIQNISDKYGYVPYIINCAGIMPQGTLDSLSPETINHAFELNAYAPLEIMSAFLPAMKSNNFGRIINITSGAPFNCFQGFGGYSASKAALNAFSITAANEHKDFDIKVNLMSPGPVKTEMAPQAPMDVSVCHDTVKHLLNLDKDGVTGGFYWLGRRLPASPDHEGIQWLEGTADDQKFPKVV